MSCLNCRKVLVIVSAMNEHQHQVKVMEWSRANTPRLRPLVMLHAIPNGGHRAKKTAADLKAEGVKKGVPDLCLPYPCGGFHGLYIEMKAEGGSPSEDQEWWIEMLKGAGYCVQVCWGHESAIAVLDGYLTGSILREPSPS